MPQLCIHLSYLEDQRNLKIYNKKYFKNIYMESKANVTLVVIDYQSFSDKL